MRIFNRLVAWIYSLASLYVSVIFILIWLDPNFTNYFCERIHAIEPYKFALVGGALLMLGAIWLASVIEHHYRTRSVSFNGPGGLVRVQLSAVEDFLMNEVRQHLKAVKRIRTSTLMTPKGLQVFNQLVIWSGYDIPTVTGKVQDLIKRLLEDTIGVERVGDIRISVSRISAGESGGPVEEDEDEEELAGEDTEIH
ncbi:MAG TPA: hypothetical protein PKN80_09380 [bacterium]|nr:hypothetical protein [bacterium]HNS49520.1 hypothetical protein [bacterium]